MGAAIFFTYNTFEGCCRKAPRSSDYTLRRMREDNLSQERRTISALKYVRNENITAFYSFVFPRILLLKFYTLLSVLLLLM